MVVAPGAYLLALDLLPADEAYDLLGRRLGHDRLAAEPAAAGHIVAQCAGLQLALAIVTAQACARPALPLAKLAARTWEAPNVLDGLAGNDAATDARQVFAWSYQALSPAAARLFRLLSLHPGLDVTPVGAASLANLPPAAASALRAELTTAHLVTSPALDRYALHDLLRAYAAELAVAVDPDDAWHYLVRALDLFSELGDQVGQPCAHANIYIALGQQQRLQDALRHARKALALHRAAGNSAAVPGGTEQPRSGIRAGR